MNYLQLYEKLGKQQLKFMKNQIEIETNGIRKPLELKFENNKPYFKTQNEEAMKDLEVIQRLYEILDENDGILCLDISCWECPFSYNSPCPRNILRVYWRESVEENGYEKNSN